MVANVPQGGCTKESIGNGMEKCVSIAVTKESLVVLYLYSSEPQRSPCN